MRTASKAISLQELIGAMSEEHLRPLSVIIMAMNGHEDAKVIYEKMMKVYRPETDALLNLSRLLLMYNFNGFDTEKNPVQMRDSILIDGYHRTAYAFNNGIDLIHYVPYTGNHKPTSKEKWEDRFGLTESEKVLVDVAIMEIQDKIKVHKN